LSGALFAFKPFFRNDKFAYPERISTMPGKVWRAISTPPSLQSIVCRIAVDSRAGGSSVVVIMSTGFTYIHRAARNIFVCRLDWRTTPRAESGTFILRGS
jgi:hypothetical protein